MKKTFLYEIPAFYLILFAIQNYFFQDKPSFYMVAPHPYWLGILLFAMRYGLAAGAFSGLCAAGLYLGGLWVWGERYLFEDADFYALPTLFVAAGCAFGGGVDRLLRLLKKREERIEDLSGRNRAMIRELWMAKQANRALEQQVVSQMSTLATLYQGARNLGSLDRAALLDGILDFFCQALQASKAALYTRTGEAWVLHGTRGWETPEAYPRSLAFTEGLVGKAGSENRVVSLREWFGDLEKAWEEGRRHVDAILAGPLRRAPGEVIGVFSVQDMPFLRFNSASVNLLTLLLDWAEEAIAKCAYFEELQSKSILDEVYNVYNLQYFQNRSRQEFARSKTYALPFSLLLVSVEGLSALPKNRQVHTLRALSRLLLENCRDIDIVTKFSEPEIPFTILMMTATAERARELRQGILKAYKKLGFLDAPDGQTLQLKIGVGSFAQEMKSMGDILEQAKLELN